MNRYNAKRAFLKTGAMDESRRANGETVAGTWTSMFTIKNETQFLA